MSHHPSSQWIASVEIYTRHYCSFCTRARALLDTKQVSYTEHAIGGDVAAREKMIERAKGRSTYPQIFINDEPVGGFTELQQLAHSGELDVLLQARRSVDGETSESVP